MGHRRVLQITRRAGVPLIINDRVDVAMAIGAGTVQYVTIQYVTVVHYSTVQCNKVTTITL